MTGKHKVFKSKQKSVVEPGYISKSKILEWKQTEMVLLGPSET